MIKLIIGTLTTTIGSVLGAILYRLGGASKEAGKLEFPWVPDWLINTRARDIGVAFVSIIVLAILLKLIGLQYNWKIFLSFVLSMGLMWGALSTYKYFLPKPIDYQWYHFALHGFFIALAMLPVAYNRKGMYIRLVVLAALMSLWSTIIKNDKLEERGRGFLTVITMPLLLIK